MSIPLPERVQRFGVGDRIYAVVSHFGPDGSRILGTVVQVYLMGTMYHYVVRFDDDKESVLFDFEMIGT